MFVSETKYRVLYGDTDNMGFVYYGNYPRLFERGRTEAIRELGISYKGMEEIGVGMPVRDMKVRYFKPAHYDDHLLIKTTVEKLPEARIEFKYDIFNEENILINSGETTLVFLDLKTMRPTRAPEYLLEKLRPYFD
jgi:acyl-CoA thioester hydrolase